MGSPGGLTGAPTFVLLHSLLLGPLSWAPVAARLTAAGAVAVVPSLTGVTTVDDPPFWPRVAETVAAAVGRLPAGRPIVLVAHSNAGLHVPAVTQAAPRPVTGCLFVDASLPARTGPTPATSPERLAALRARAVDGRLPPWTTWWDEDEVASLFPGRESRSAVSAEQPRVPVRYYEQLFPVPPGWDHRPCGYVLFGPPYDRMAEEAHRRGWPVTHLPGGHLHQLIDPAGVADRLLTMTQAWGPSTR